MEFLILSSYASALCTRQSITGSRFLLSCFRSKSQLLSKQRSLLYFHIHPFAIAVRSGCCDILEYLVQCGVSPQDSSLSYGPEGSLSLGYHALFSQSPEVIKTLFSLGFTSFGTRQNDESFLMSSISFKRWDVARTLIEAGSPVNYKTKKGRTALLHAFEQKHVPTIRLLLQYGADVGPGPSGQTPVHWAVSLGSLKVLLLVLEHGADPLILGKDGVFYLFIQHLSICSSLTTFELLRR